MQDIMFEVPSNPEIKSVTITGKCITEKAEPKIVLNNKDTAKKTQRSTAVKGDKTAS